MTTANLIEISCILDEFYKYFATKKKKNTLEVPGKRHRNRPSCMSNSEIMTILLPFHTRHFRDLKSFYLCYICQHIKKSFPIGSLTTASWSVRHRFVSLAAVRPNMRTWQVHRHIHHRFHTSCVMPHQA